MRKFITAISALLVSSVVAIGASIPLLTGPQDPSQLYGTINQLIATINQSVGVLGFSAGPVSSSTTATEATLQFYTVPASFLTTTGQGLRATCWGNSTTTHVHSVALYFGAHSVSFTNSQNGTNWYAQLTAMRTGTTADSVYGSLGFGLTQIAVYASLGTDPITVSPVAIKCTAVQASAQDITADGLLIELLK